MNIRTTGMSAAAWLLAIGMAAAAPSPDSKRMGRAKDFIADEQWGRAIVELQAAVDDPKETNRAEALFWLAHSQHQAGDDSSALQSIARLERTASTSPWVHPARSLRIEIAQRLGLDGWLWTMAAPPAPPTPAAAPVRPGAAPRPIAMTPAAVPVPPTMPTTAPPPAVPMPAPPALPPGVTAPPSRSPHPARPPVAPAPPPPAPFAPTPWTSEIWVVPAPGETDGTLRVQALRGLLDAHSTLVIPLLRQIALDRNSPDEGRMAVFALGQSRVPEARRTVVEIAHDAPEPVRIAAVRELARFDGASISTELMRVYTTSSSTSRLRSQVVSSLGERADNVSLLRIVKLEEEPTVRNYAIVTLGRTGARAQLHTLYAQAPANSRLAVLAALCAVKDDDELIRIAQTERDPGLRLRARQQLHLLATPKALKFLEDNP